MCFPHKQYSKIQIPENVNVRPSHALCIAVLRLSASLFLDCFKQIQILKKWIGNGPSTTLRSESHSGKANSAESTSPEKSRYPISPLFSSLCCSLVQGHWQIDTCGNLEKNGM